MSVQKSGYLRFKERNVIRNLEKKWIVLRSDILYFYENAQSTALPPTDNVRLENVMDVFSTELKGGFYPFKVKVPERRYKFHCETSKQRDEWITALRKAAGLPINTTSRNDQTSGPRPIRSKYLAKKQKRSSPTSSNFPSSSSSPPPSSSSSSSPPPPSRNLKPQSINNFKPSPPPKENPTPPPVPKRTDLSNSKSSSPPVPPRPDINNKNNNNNNNTNNNSNEKSTIILNGKEVKATKVDIGGNGPGVSKPFGFKRSNESQAMNNLMAQHQRGEISYEQLQQELAKVKF